MKCPECKADIDSDSVFCDQCGKELLYCPKCGEAKRGVSCPRCGSLLVRKTGMQSGALHLCGNGWNLELKEGDFGRRTGVYPEFSTVPYISSRHGALRRSEDKWQVMDCGSTNGTFLNGNRLQPDSWHDLAENDKLVIATVEFELKR